MVAQKGKDLLLKIGNGGTYVTVAGLRSRRLDLWANFRQYWHPTLIGGEKKAGNNLTAHSFAIQTVLVTYSAM